MLHPNQNIEWHKTEKELKNKLRMHNSLNFGFFTFPELKLNYGCLPLSFWQAVSIILFLRPDFHISQGLEGYFQVFREAGKQ